MIEAARRAVVLAALAAAAAIAPARTAHAGDPTLRYFTIETDHFVIHYYEPLGDVARRVGVVIERAYRTLVPSLDHEPAGKTIVVLVDDTDSANGFAGVLPRNAIQLFATAPPAFSELDDHDDWLYGLAAHELTHIIHLDTIEGLPVLYNRLFGKTWSPNQLMPRWVIEGVAVYQESKRSSGGRNRGSRFEQVIRVAQRRGREMRFDEINGVPRRFPHGNAPYIYGSHFLRYVFDRYGDDTARAMSHAAGSHPAPYAINRQIAKVVGRPFTELYGEWSDYLRDRYSMQEMAVERRGAITGRPLTRSAEANFFAQYSPDGSQLLWLQFDGYRQPVVRAMPVGGDAGQARDVIKGDLVGPFDVLADGSLIYEQGRRSRIDYAFQDLFRWDARTGETVRLSTGMRARDPSASPDGRRVAFAKNTPSESVLAVMDVAPGAPASVVWRGERFDQAYQPAWSPDGGRIAFSAWRKGGNRDILVVELASGAVEQITRDRAVDMAPAWSADGRLLYFDSDRTGISNIYAYDTADRSLWQVTNVIGGAFHAHPSPDGKRLAFEAAVSTGGYDLYELMIDRASWLPARDHIDDRPPPIAIRDDEAKVSAPRRYRALETMAPRSYTAQLQLAEAPSLAVQTGGADAFGLHNYSLALGADLRNGDLDVAASYAYTGLRPSLRIASSRAVGARGGFRIDGVPAQYRQEDWSWTLSTSIPFEARPGDAWTLSFDYDLDWFRAIDAPELTPDPNQRVPVRPLTDYVQSGLASRLSYSRVRGAIYTVGPQVGFDTSISVRLDHPALGATYRNITVNYGFNYYRRLFGATPVLATRLVGGFRAGDLVRGGGFSLGGVPAQDVVRSVIDSTRFGFTGYLRGYPARTVAGNQFHLVNLEYRQQLLEIERGIHSLPIYFRRVTIAGLADAGTAFDGAFDAGRHLRAALGGALRLDALFGYYVPGTFEVGYARGLVNGGVHETWFLLTGTL